MRESLLRTADHTYFVWQAYVNSQLNMQGHVHGQCQGRVCVQSYLVCPVESKLNVLWSFVRNHLRNKILVFLASCKQVRGGSAVWYETDGFCD